MGKYNKSLPLTESEVEALKCQLIIQEIREIANSLEEQLHFYKYYNREINPQTLETLHKRMEETAKDFA